MRLSPWSSLTIVAATLFASAAFAVFKGRPVAENEPMWQSTVLIEGDDSYCTGVFIARDVMLTATHCYVGKRRGETKNRGPLTIYFFKGAQVVEAKSARPDQYFLATNPDYDIRDTFTRFGFDIAVVVFKDRDMLPEGREPAEMPSAREASKIAIGQSALMIGAGRNERDESGGLRSAVGQVTEHTGPSALTIETRSKSGICFGDSGGPLFYRSPDEPGKLRLIGILSDFAMHVDNRGMGTCTPGGIYTWLGAGHQRWVRRKIELGRKRLATNCGREKCS